MPNTAIPVASFSFLIEMSLVLICTALGPIATHLKRARDCPKTEPIKQHPRCQKSRAFKMHVVMGERVVVILML